MEYFVTANNFWIICRGHCKREGEVSRWWSGLIFTQCNNLSLVRPFLTLQIIVVCQAGLHNFFPVKCTFFVLFVAANRFLNLRFMTELFCFVCDTRAKKTEKEEKSKRVAMHCDPCPCYQ
jgi:hypothetical protein